MAQIILVDQAVKPSTGDQTMYKLITSPLLGFRSSVNTSLFDWRSELITNLYSDNRVRRRLNEPSRMECPIPVIDISPFLANYPLQSTTPTLECLQTSQALYRALAEWGFCLIKGHGIPPQLREEIFQSADKFFALPEDKKLALHVKKGGVAWRGFMPRGGEATHGFTDHKEGMYFGPEHPENHHHSGLPLVRILLSSSFDTGIHPFTSLPTAHCSMERTSSQMTPCPLCVQRCWAISTK